MTPYIILLSFIFVIRLFSNLISDKQKSIDFFLRAVFIYLYIFCVIRDFNVGIDIEGYMLMYEKTKLVHWDNWDYVYFENGYIALMKICNMIGLSARGFFYVVYFIILFPIYLFIKKYSPKPLLSVILYICYQFFVFDLTGLRQAIAMSIVLLAYMFLLRQRSKDLLRFIIVVLIAMTIHRSSIIALATCLIIRIPINFKTLTLFIAGMIACTALNQVGVAEVLALYDNTHYMYSTDESQQLGLSLVLMILFTLCTMFATKVLSRNKDASYVCSLESKMAVLLAASVCLMCLFNGSILLRSTMYLYIVFIISIPIFASCFDRISNTIITVTLCLLMITFFFLSDLNSFNVVPYEIGKDQALFSHSLSSTY